MNIPLPPPRFCLKELWSAYLCYTKITRSFTLCHNLLPLKISGPYIKYYSYHYHLKVHTAIMLVLLMVQNYSVLKWKLLV
jgi:hypothetical protein